jgi:hypothetical protein
MQSKKIWYHRGTLGQRYKQPRQHIEHGYHLQTTVHNPSPAYEKPIGSAGKHQQTTQQGWEKTRYG